MRCQLSLGVMLFTRLLKYARSRRTLRPHLRHLIPMSAPIRTISHSYDPQACGLRIVTRSPICIYVAFLSQLISACMSPGAGASNDRRSPVTGWSKDKENACRA